MSLLSAFNNLLEQFITEMIMTFPDLGDLRTIQTLVGLMRRTNPRMVLENFLDVAGRYYEKILIEDSDFFEDLDNWTKDPRFAEEAEGEEEDLFQKLAVFKSVWYDLSENNKETIWTYFKQLLIIGAKANKNELRKSRCQDILAMAIQVHQSSK